MRTGVLIVGMAISGLLVWQLGWRWAGALSVLFLLFLSVLLAGEAKSVPGGLFLSSWVLSIAVGGFLASPEAKDILRFATGAVGGACIYAIGAVTTIFTPGVFEGLKSLVSRLSRGEKGLTVHIVDAGQVTSSSLLSSDRTIKGPCVAEVRSGTAIVVEENGELLDIHGPGRVEIGPKKFISAIVDLRLQTRVYPPCEEILTKDGIPLKIKFTVLYRIMGDETALITEGKYTINKEAIRRAVLSAANWRRQTEMAAKAILRDTMAGYYLDEIYDPMGHTHSGRLTPREPLQATLCDRLNDESQRWGVEIVKVTLDEIHMPDAVKQRMLQAWDVNWAQVVELAKAKTEAQSLITRAWGHAKAVAEIEETKARLKVELIRSILSEVEGLMDVVNDPNLLRYLSAITQLSQSMLIDETLALRYLDVIEEVANNELATVVLPNAGSGFIMNLGRES